MFEFQNKVRREPKSFVPYLEKQYKKFKGLKLFNDDESDFLLTKEGPKAYLEAITFLKC